MTCLAMVARLSYPPPPPALPHQNAIREKQQALNFLRLASRIEGVASRVEGAVRMNSLTASMKGVVDGMDDALKSMDTDKVSCSTHIFLLHMCVVCAVLLKFCVLCPLIIMRLYRRPVGDFCAIGISHVIPSMWARWRSRFNPSAA